MANHGGAPQPIDLKGIFDQTHGSDAVTVGGATFVAVTGRDKFGGEGYGPSRVRVFRVSAAGERSELPPLLQDESHTEGTAMASLGQAPCVGYTVSRPLRSGTSVIACLEGEGWRELALPAAYRTGNVAGLERFGESLYVLMHASPTRTQVKAGRRAAYRLLRWAGSRWRTAGPPIVEDPTSRTEPTARLGRSYGPGGSSRPLLGLEFHERGGRVSVLELSGNRWRAAVPERLTEGLRIGTAPVSVGSKLLFAVSRRSAPMQDSLAIFSNGRVEHIAVPGASLGLLNTNFTSGKLWIGWSSLHPPDAKNRNQVDIRAASIDMRTRSVTTVRELAVWRFPRTFVAIENPRIIDISGHPYALFTDFSSFVDGPPAAAQPILRPIESFPTVKTG